MLFHLCGLRFPAFMRKSVLLLGQYPNCFRTCTRGLMSASDPILSLISLPFLSRVLPLLPRGTGLSTRLNFLRSRWRCQIISGFHVWKRKSTVKNYQILDTIRAFILLVFNLSIFISSIFYMYSTIQYSKYK